MQFGDVSLFQCLFFASKADPTESGVKKKNHKNVDFSLWSNGASTVFPFLEYCAYVVYSRWHDAHVEKKLFSLK